MKKAKKAKKAIDIFSVLVFVLIVLATNSCRRQDMIGTQRVVQIQIGLENHPGEPTTEAIYEWARLANERSGGSLVMEVFPSSQLGSKDELADMMLAGMSVITLANGGFFAARGAPDMGIVFGPYFYPSWEDAWKLQASDWWKEQERLLEARGLKILAPNWQYGDRHTLTTRPIRTVEDMRGLKLRVPNNPMQVLGTNVMGAIATPMPMAEVYTALQQGVIDGVENPLAVLYGSRWFEIAPYLSLTGHIRDNTMWFTGTAFFNSLSPEHQRILVETGIEAGCFNNRLMETADQEALQRLMAAGVTVIEIDVNSFVRATRSFYTLPELTRQWSPGLYETTSRAMGRR